MRTLGFTFIEVLVAMLIFVLAALSAVDLARGAVRATIDSKEVSTAAWLLQKSMVELETRIETDGIEKGCEKKREGKFEVPFERFRWTQYCNEIDFQLSQSAAQLMAAQGDAEKEEAANKEDIFLKMILELASTHMTKSMRELHTEVSWIQGKTPRSLSVTTHYGRYDLPVNLPAIPGVGGGGEGSGSPAPDSSGGSKASPGGGSPG